MNFLYSPCFPCATVNEGSGSRMHRTTIPSYKHYLMQMADCVVHRQEWMVKKCMVEANDATVVWG